MIQAVRLGVVASTDTRLPDRLSTLFLGVERVLHAGGIGSSHVLDCLGAIAPVEAVVADRDYLEFSGRFPESVELQIAGARIWMTALIGSIDQLLPIVRQRLESDPPDVLIHSHDGVADLRWVGGTLFLNPGVLSQHRARGTRPTCALLEILGPGRIEARIESLDL
jgi:hypothetical protein